MLKIMDYSNRIPPKSQVLFRHCEDCANEKQSGIVFERKAMKHNEPNGNAGELMLELDEAIS